MVCPLATVRILLFSGYYSIVYMDGGEMKIMRWLVIYIQLIGAAGFAIFAFCAPTLALQIAAILCLPIPLCLAYIIWKDKQ